MKSEQYVILDLEMCKVPFSRINSKFSCKNEIIEIGAVLVNTELEIIDSFNTYIKPQYGVLDESIRKLTGISYSDLRNAPVLENALEQFNEWLPDNSIIVSWSDNDKNQLYREIYNKQIEIQRLNKYECSWRDCQQEFSDRMNRQKKFRLSEALAIADLDYDVHIHEALVDANNTALLFIKMQKETVLKLSPYYNAESCESVSDKLTYKPFANLGLICG